MSLGAGSHHRGESLLEVIIAIAVLLLLAAPAGGLFVRSVRAGAFNRLQLVAANLANEGVEMVRTMRDTNLLRFSARSNECWDTAPEFDDIDTCEQHPIDPGSYKLSLTTDPAAENFLSWLLVPADRPLSDTLVAETDPDLLLKLDPDTGLYNHDRGTDTPFYREVIVTRLNLDGQDVDDALKVVAHVRFRSGAKVYTLTRSTLLTRLGQAGGYSFQ